MSAVGEQLERVLAGAVAIVGVGNRGRGDDGAGPALIDKLQGRTGAPLVEAEEVPESYLGEIVACEADTVLLVDAVDFGGRPGEVGLFSREDLPGRPTFSTHRVPLRLVMEYLEAESGARVLLLGVQPQLLCFGRGLSAPVQGAVEALADALADLLGTEAAGAFRATPCVAAAKERGL